MKSLLVLSIIFLTVICSPPSHAQAPPTDKLEKCAEAMAREGEAVSQEASWFIGYQNGFLGALPAQPFFSRQAEPETFKYVATEAMRSPQKAAESLHQFIAKYKPAGFQSNGEQDTLVMTAWFLSNCKGSDGAAKMKAVLALHAAYGFTTAIEEFSNAAIRQAMLEKGPQIRETLHRGIDAFEKDAKKTDATPP
ncbi:MAG: hypothetical protein V4819_03875 [Verrucomicrobiota bacterium]